MSGANVLTQIVERRTETCDRLDPPAAKHRVVPLFHGTIVLLSLTAPILVTRVAHLTDEPVAMAKTDALELMGDAEAAIHLERPYVKRPSVVIRSRS